VTGSANRILVLIVLLTIGFFCWNFAEFFTPDGVYYFGRRFDSVTKLVSAFSDLDNRGQYRPLGLVVFSFLLYPLLGTNPLGYHVLALLFHIANILLVYGIARALHPDWRVGLGAAFFFALHRVNFFVTFGVTFMPDFLGCFFFLAALLVYIKRRGTRRYVLALALWIMALGNKETAIVFPALLLAYEWLFREAGSKDRLWTSILKPVLPFAALSLVFLAFMLHLRSGNLYAGDASHPYHASFSVSSLMPKVKYFWWAVNLPEGSGLGNAVMPGVIRSASLPKLSVPYPLPTLLAAGLMLPIAVWLSVFVVLRLLRTDRLVVFGAAAFLLALAPVLPLTGRVMHHNLYFSLLGLALLFGEFLTAVLETRVRVLAPVVALIFIFSTAVGVANKRHNSWPVTSARIAKQLLEDFRLAARSRGICETRGVVIARTGIPDFVWYSDGGNLFRVFGPCPEIEVYFEDLGQTSPDPRIPRLGFQLTNEAVR